MTLVSRVFWVKLSLKLKLWWALHTTWVQKSFNLNHILSNQTFGRLESCCTRCALFSHHSTLRACTSWHRRSFKASTQMCLLISARIFHIFCLLCWTRIQAKDHQLISCWSLTSLSKEQTSYSTSKTSKMNFHIQYCITRTFLTSSEQSRHRRKLKKSRRNSKRKSRSNRKT